MQGLTILYSSSSLLLIPKPSVNKFKKQIKFKMKKSITRRKRRLKRRKRKTRRVRKIRKENSVLRNY